MKKMKLTKGRIGIVLILILSTILNITNLNIEGYSNEYYSAGVKSMLTSFKNFFFVSFDPTGFVTIDKPPVGFWMQAISAEIFGFNKWSILLPQAIAGVISVAILYCLVKRYFGVKSALISALCLAVTPIFVAASRNNTIDNQLVMVVLIASYFLFKAIESGKLKDLILCLFFVGIGFNIKMLEAYLPLPAIYFTYFIASKIEFKKRLINLSICTVILLIVSLSWATVVDLTPASSRPYVGSSSNNSEIELIVGHNGIERFTKSKGHGDRNSNDASNISDTERIHNGSGIEEVNNIEMPNEMNGRISGGAGGGKAGITRLFSKGELADQISWLLPLALFGFFAAALKEKIMKPFDNERKLSIVFWIIYLVPQFIYFSFTQGIFHSYYLTMLAPPIAALVGIGIKYLIEFYEENTWKSYLLPAALIADGALELLINSYYLETSNTAKILMGIIAVLSIGSSLLLITNKFRNKAELKVDGSLNIIKVSISVGIIGLLLTPTVWSGTTIFYKMSGSSPSAGLELTKLKSSSSEGELTESSSKLINYLIANKANEKYLLVTSKASGYASSIILETNEAVMALGGFMGTDNIVTLDEFKEMVKAGEVRYVMVESNKNLTKGGVFDIPNMTDMSQDFTSKENSQNAEIMDWAKENGKLIDRSEWSNSSENKIANSKQESNGFNMGNGVSELYDLRGCVIN